MPAMEALPGNMLTAICGRTVTLADAVSPLSAWLIAVTVIGFGDGKPAGAR